MIKSSFYFDKDHANQYIGACVIRFKGDPVFVNKVMNGDKELILDISKVFEMDSPDKAQRVGISHAELDTSPFLCGFMNVTMRKGPNMVARFSRMPARRWKVGTTHHNSQFFPLNELTYIRDWTSYIYSKDFVVFVKGEYPSVEDAIRECTVDGAQRAISRHFGLCRTGKVYHQHIAPPVGKFTPKGEIILDGQYRFLQEQLNEVVK